MVIRCFFRMDLPDCIDIGHCPPCGIHTAIDTTLRCFFFEFCIQKERDVLDQGNLDEVCYSELTQRQIEWQGGARYHVKTTLGYLNKPDNL